jgi:type I restriction enzyme R subunit
MSFNELNSVEYYIVHQLSGVNLNHKNWQEEKIPYGFQWGYKSADKLKRGVNEVIEEGIYALH